jgi:hypothetical protein
MPTKSRLLWVPAPCLAVILSSVCAAQAWVPNKGEGEFSVVYQNIYTHDHLDKDSRPFDAGHVRVLAVVQSVDFGLTDKLAVSAALPVESGKYDGNFPHTLPIDNGNYHGGVGDFHLAVRYQLREHPLTITPFIAVSFPTVPYQHFAHSAIGSDMWEVGLGFSAGRRLDPWLPHAYLQTRYTFVITQRETIRSYNLRVRPNHSRMDAELGYFLTRRWSVRGLASAQVTHSGLDTSDFPPSIQLATNELWRHHDQISAMHYLNAGVGVDVSMTRSLDAFVTFEKTAWGENTHALNAGITAGVSWSFRTPWSRAKTTYAQQATNWRSKPTEVKLCH